MWQSQKRVNFPDYQDVSIEHRTQSSDCAVYIRDLCKKYRNGPPILEQLCMSVRKRTIYGLLGSSGSGKSTALSCIVGLSTWDSGSVHVFGKTPGLKDSGIPGKKLGYMPQDVALYSHLTISENVRFYQRIYQITGTCLSKRWTFLNKLMDLPCNSKFISNLSGGEKRRVSLALALIHSPELLILDEPTVGLDPLLRHKIWDHLSNLVKSVGTTIIITTHYIDEARHSNTVGMLRNGRLLVENTPFNILQKFHCHLLENAVLQLCKNNENSKQDDTGGRSLQLTGSHSHQTSFNRDSDDTFLCECNEELSDLGHIICTKNNSTEISHQPRFAEFYSSMQTIHGLVAVIFQTCCRYPVLLVAILLLPTVQGFLTAWIAGTKPIGLHFGIVNDELRNWTEECCSSSVYSANSCNLIGLSCRYIDELKNDTLLILDAFESEKEALTAAQLGKIWGYIRFPPNYTQHVIDLAMTRQFALNESVQGAQLIAHLDHSQYITAFFMMEHLFSSYFSYVRKQAISCGQISEKMETSTLYFRKAVFGKDNGGDYMDYMVAGTLASCFMCFPAIMSAVLLISDRKQGTFNRAHATGVTMFEVIISHLITQGAMCIIEWILFVATMHFHFGWVIQGSPWLCLALCLLLGIGSAQFGAFLGLIFRDEGEAILFVIFMVPFTLLYGGNVWPVEGMPKIGQYISKTLPINSPMKSMRSLAVRGVGLSHSLVWPGFVEIAGWMILFSVLCWLITKFKKV